MKCLCPKCSTSIQIEEPLAPEKGEFTNCPECNGKFWVHRESFALRAFKKDGKIFCSHCGEEPGTDFYCQACFKLYPDYWVVQASKPAQRKIHRASDSPLALSKPKGYAAMGLRKPGAGPSESRSKKSIFMPIASVILAIVLVVVGVNFYLNKQVEQEFVDNFVLTLYGIKSGTEASLKELDKMMDAQRVLDSNEIGRLEKIKAEIDEYRQKLESPPEKFQSSTEKLSKYYNVYSSLQDLAITSSGRSANLPGQIKTLEDSVSKAEGDLKKNIAEPLRKKVDAVVGKYRNLQFMVQ